MTPNRARDDLIEAIPLTTEAVATIKKLGLDCADARKSDYETYLKCPRCYGLHSIHGNYDNLCDECAKIILECFPNHESVPHIKLALAKWSNPINPDAKP